MELGKGVLVESLKELLAEHGSMINMRLSSTDAELLNGVLCWRIRSSTVSLKLKEAFITSKLAIGVKAYRCLVLRMDTAYQLPTEEVARL